MSGGFQVYTADGRLKQQAAAAPVILDTWHDFNGVGGNGGFFNSAVNLDGGAAAPSATSGARNCGYRLYPDGKAKLRGVLKAGVSGASALLLPPGYRPPVARLFGAYASGGTAQIEVQAGGAIFATNITGTVTTWVSLDGIEFDTESVLSMPGGAAGTPQLVTALPPNPYDGQEVHFLADAAKGVLWHLRYRAASTASSKWEVVGGSPLWADLPGVGSETTASTSYVDLTTPGPSITLPLPGDYDIETECLTNVNSVNQGTYMSFAIGATAAVDADASVSYHGSVGDGLQQHRRRRKTGLAAVTLTAKYKTSGGTALFYGPGTAGGGRTIQAMPVRVG